MKILMKRVALNFFFWREGSGGDRKNRNENASQARMVARRAQ